MDAGTGSRRRSRLGADARARAGESFDVAFYVPWIASLLAPGSAPPPGGAETQLDLLARELARLGHRVCVIAYDVPGLPASVAGVKVIPRPPARWLERRDPASKLREIATVLRTVRKVEAKTFVQRGTTMEAGLVAVAAKARRRRFVYSSANEIDFDWGSVASRKSTALFRLGVRLADEIVVQTAEQDRLCRERFGREPVLIRSLVEPAEARRQQPEAFLWIGKLASYKQPLEYAELARALPEARFWMIGVPSENDSAAIGAELTATAAAIPNLELLQPRPRGELMELVGRAVAIVSTSEYEGMANVMLEGWARGVPTLTLAHDPDGLIEAQRLGACAHGSRERLMALTRELWRSRHDLEQTAERCREYVERVHSPNAAARRWAEPLALALEETVALCAA